MEYEKLFPNPIQMYSSFSYNQLNTKVSEYERNNFQQAADPFKELTENFDLSLLPNELVSDSLTASKNSNRLNDNKNIPTTVYQYNDLDFTIKDIKNFVSVDNLPENKFGKNILKTKADEINHELFIAPNQTSLLFDHLSRQKDHFDSNRVNKKYLVPPPPYPNIYPSPQSSPPQSDYNFSCSHKLGYYETVSSSRSSLYSSSPCPSLESGSVKQELNFLPPSPPDSNFEAHSPRSNCTDIKSEPFDIETELPSIDLNALLEANRSNNNFMKNHSYLESNKNSQISSEEKLGNLLLNECFDDNNLQSKISLKSLALESLIVGLESKSEDFEPVISLAFEHVKKDAEVICNKLQISPDPTAWSSIQVHAWLRSTIEQFKLPQIENLESKFNEDGANLLLLTEEEFLQRVPQGGSTLHAQLEIWKMAYIDEYQRKMMPSTSHNNSSHSFASSDSSLNAHERCSKVSLQIMEIDDDSDGEEGQEVRSDPQRNNFNQTCRITNNTASVNKRTSIPSRNGGSHIHLWQFLKELLQSPQINGTAIRWIDRSKGIFKIEDSVRVAKLWGKRKNRPAMNYDKLSRSIRQYYKKGIMKKTERSQRLVYQFCHPYYL